MGVSVCLCLSLSLSLCPQSRHCRSVDRPAPGLGSLRLQRSVCLSVPSPVIAGRWTDRLLALALPVFSAASVWESLSVSVCLWLCLSVCSSVSVWECLSVSVSVSLSPVPSLQVGGQTGFWPRSLRLQRSVSVGVLCLCVCSSASVCECLCGSLCLSLCL